MMSINKVWKIVSIVALATLLFTLVLYVVGLKSDGYAFAVKSLRESPQLFSEIGQIKNERLSFVGYSIKTEGPNVYADYRIMLKGETGKAKVYISVRKYLGEWQVVAGNFVVEGGTGITAIIAPSINVSEGKK